MAYQTSLRQPMLAGNRRPQSTSQLNHTRSFAIARAALDGSITEARPRAVPVPVGPAQQTSQAVAAITSAWKAGVKRQRVELLLPLIGATDLDDWPGGIRQQFKAAQPLVEQILRGLKQVEGLQGPLTADIWDQGDAVGAWTGAKLGAVLFPTAEVMSKLRQLSTKADAPELLLIVNPQWESQGNLMSTFGFGQRKADNIKLADSFKPTYYVKSYRVYGDELRLLKCAPGQWQLHLVNRQSGDATECIGMQESQPTYQEIEALLRSRPGSQINKSWVDRAKDEYQFNKDSLQNGPR